MGTRALHLACLVMLVLAAPLAASTEIPHDDAYEVIGDHSTYGSVAGYLAVSGSRGELWLSGSHVVSFYAAFTFPCDSYGASVLVAEECSGSQGKRFVGAYTVDDQGEPSGFASGTGEMYGFDLRATGHT